MVDFRLYKQRHAQCRAWRLYLEAAAEAGVQRSVASTLLQGGGADADVPLQAPQVQTRTQNPCDVVPVELQDRDLVMPASGMICSQAPACLLSSNSWELSSTTSQ